ncbi:isocitrate lyase/phosphoenolpyruvate mutase family protein [Streptomyces sp. NPDC093225]|uniref:isocitrate lyase/PEP mutase family protein n=1 Tax=Streptomyces sp. NPDC093225 TaxID=3366034 RepID=UPI003809A2F5
MPNTTNTTSTTGTTRATDTARTAATAAFFHSLHVPGKPLVLPNAWDVASARLVAGAGAAALATTSAGVAWSLGHGDGGHLARDEALAALGRIADAVDIPVTADIEAGYAEDPAGVAETVRRVLAAGIVGVNLEDGLRPVAEQTERLAAARAAANAAGVPLYLNARIDTHRLLPAGTRGRWLPETLERAHAYAAAGADGVFVLGTLRADEVRALVSASPLPVNVSAGPGSLPVAELAAAGAARISAGAALAEAAYGLAARAARELLTEGTTTSLEGGLDYPTLNTLLLASAERARPAPHPAPRPTP